MKTIDNIERYLRKEGVSGLMASRIKRVAEQFATTEAFFAASKADLLKAYSRASPNSGVDLGKKFWTVYDMALAYFKSSEDVDAEKGEVIEDHADLKDELKLISLEDLKLVVNFMELCDVESICFMEIIGFLRNVRMRQKKDGDPKEPQEGGV